MDVPAATYRLQFSKDFTFEHARKLVPYLHELGITHIYASPLLKSRAGSTHGYDVADPSLLDPELGTDEDFARLVDELHARDMSVLLDIVPNHMAADAENPWWQDVLALGLESAYARYFDIDWEGGGGKVLLPILGSPIEQELADGNIQIVRNNGTAQVRYGDTVLPVAPGTFSGEELPSEVLARQHYRLEYWESGERHLNYRRFFAVQELVSLREEDPQVFHAAHEQVLTLLRLGQVTALRVDHVDGLRDPQAYLERLQMAARAQSVDPDEEVYVVIEKILAHDEDLRPEWTCHGTTGYEFMTALNGLFVDPGGLEALDRVYADFTGESESYHELAYRSKRQVMEELFPGEMRSLGRRLCGIARSDSMASGIDENHLRTALEEVTAALPVYRTYVRNAEVSETDRRYIGEAVATARVRHGGVPGSAFDFVERVLTLDAPSDAQEWLAFTMRWQQFTSPITAKGIEDTAFYRYNRLISMNEVGAEPLLDVTTPGNFHAMNVRRLATYPHSMNSTSTHDTKRSEDVRARINALSEIPAEWADIANGWREANARHRTLIEDVEAPDASEEYAIYQTLLGAWPLDVDTDDLRARMAPFVEKALREEKTHTTWSHPNEQYESAVHNFADRLFADQSFVEQVKSLSERIAVPFVVNSLAQVVLKATAPGVPDVYQGTEIWDFSLVDPDNRRPVDFDRFNSMMQSLPQDMSELLADWRSGGVKLGTLQRVLQFRRANPQLFSAGEYVPLAVTGELADHVVAFARRLDDRQALIIVPRLVAGFSDWPIADAWRDTLVVLPPDSRACWRNILMGATFKPSGEMRVSDALATFPIAVLSNEAPAAKVGSYAASRPAISFSLRPAVPLIPRPIPEQPADSGQ